MVKKGVKNIIQLRYSGELTIFRSPEARSLWRPSTQLRTFFPLSKVMIGGLQRSLPPKSFAHPNNFSPEALRLGHATEARRSGTLRQPAQMTPGQVATALVPCTIGESIVVFNSENKLN